MTIDHKGFTILPRTITTAAPTMAAEEIRADWEWLAMTRDLVQGWAAADLAGIGDNETAADLFNVVCFGA